MPTIAKLPAAQTPSPTDTMPIDQGSGTNGITLATLLAGQQSAIVAPTGTLLGRMSIGAGGPETITLGSGLIMTSGTIAVGGPLTGLLDGQTVDELQAAGIIHDTDSFPLDQGGTALLRQSMAAVWTYIAGKLPIATKRMVELTTNTVLDATAHNGAILVCTQPITLTANFANMGSGFTCDVLNLSTNSVTMGTGITVGSGDTALPVQMAAHISAIAYSGGNIVFWPGPSATASTGDGSGGGGDGDGGSTPSATLTFATAPSGSYAVGQTSIGVNATLDPGTAASAVQFGISASATAAPTSWTAGALVNTQSNGDTFWGAYLTMPATAGTYYCWVATPDGTTSAVSPSFTVA
ncbi:hypothetical protein ACELLULO517_09290 [Acidisoma cellulosilytica]|uniref:Uncharacterized protein n=1 Tax=Acidisoma cellulosilyticum TaxID=2802395 RepID=A0A964E382_9PROT|nr:hypothetical protein [Acidisoma cellulosilyticum]MCB8880425.1 hypothetical protein [Acidisoma cellulosilyticum]